MSAPQKLWNLELAPIGPEALSYRVSLEVSLREAYASRNPTALIEGTVHQLAFQLQQRLRQLIDAGAFDDALKNAVKESVRDQVKQAVRERLDEIVDDVVEGL